MDIGLLETNGHQYYKNWDKMMTYHPKAGAKWTKLKKEYISLTNRFMKKAEEFFNLQHIMNKCLPIMGNELVIFAR